MLLGSQLSFYSGRGYLKIIKSFDIILLVKNRINSSVNLLAIVDIYTVVAVNGDLKVIIGSELLIGYIPDSVAKTVYGRLYSLSDRKSTRLNSSHHA